jgi:hypothetical protein
MRGATSAADPYIVPEDLNQVPWGGNRYPNGKIISTPRLNAGEKTLVLPLVGQSNICNSVDTAYTPTNATKVDNFNIYDGGVYRAVDPLLGCTIRDSTTQGHMFGRVADKLINAGKCARVILVPVGYSGTEIAKWTPSGILNRRLIIAKNRLAAVGLTPSLWICMDGETDNNPLGTSQSAYAASLAQVIATPGDGVPWAIGKCTYINGAVSAAIQAAQVAAVNGTTVFAGADTDSLTGTAVNRQADDTHFKAAGADAAADLWVTKIVAALAL